MDFKIRKGLDLKMAGDASDRLLGNVLSDTITVRPGDFRWLKPVLLVQVGDAVQVGTPLLADKQDERIVVVSPVAGMVQEIVRGEKRVIEEITIARDPESAAEKEVVFDNPADGESVRKLLLQYGLWPCLRQRPFSVMPSPDSTPKSIFVPCFDSNPLAPDCNVLLCGKEEHFLRGLKMLQLAGNNAPVHLCMRKDADNQLFEKADNVEKHCFSGPHPAGNVGTHIHFVDPIRKGDVVWFIHPQEVARIGQFFAEHILQFGKMAALTGPEVKNTGYFSAVYGTDLSTLLARHQRQCVERP